MPKIVVINDCHRVGYKIASWMFRDLGYKVYIAGNSFNAVMSHHHNTHEAWQQELCSGIMEFGNIPKDAIFIDTHPETEGELRKRGWEGVFLMYWILPVGPDWVEVNFKPGKRVGVLAFNRAIGRVIAEKQLCPVEFMWPPYYRMFDSSARPDFDQFMITVIQNASGWTNVPLFEKLRDNPRTRLELYGGGPPDWSRVVPHPKMLARIRKACAMFHLKTTDTPGYAVMEAVLQGVPVILPPVFLRTTEMTNLFEDGKTCVLVPQVQETEQHLAEVFERLKDSSENRRIGLAARERLLEFSNWEKNKLRVEHLIERARANS